MVDVVCQSNPFQASLTGTLLNVWVSPNSNQSAVGEIDVWRCRLTICVKSAPSNSRANEELMDLMVKELGIKSESIKIISGLKSRAKTLHLDGLEPDVTRLRLGLGD